MIKIKKMSIHKFRGIQEFEIVFDCKNYVICGPNGTGKSGIVDAIEFALTGNLSRLSGTGAGSLSIIKHAPHVDSRDRPNEAYVSLTFEIIESKKEATITRTVGNKGKPRIHPNDDEVMEVIKHVESHPEFTLSRRELIEYIFTKPKDRSAQVQALLRLEKIENIRSTLTTIKNNKQRELDGIKDDKSTAEKKLIEKLIIKDFSIPNIISAINERRVMLGLAEIQKLEKNTTIKVDLDTDSSAGVLSSIPKNEALSNINNLKEILNSLKEVEFIKSWEKALNSLNDLYKESGGDLIKIKQNKLLQLALQFYDNKECPVCSLEWAPKEFDKMIAKKMEHFSSIKDKKEKVEEEIFNISRKLKELYSSLDSVANYDHFLPESIDLDIFRQQSELLKKNADSIKDVSDLLKVIEIFQNKICDVEGIFKTLTDIKKEILSIPEASEKNKAKEYLATGEESLKEWMDIVEKFDKCETENNIAQKTHEIYEEVTSFELNKIYKKVKDTFKEFYRFINQDDEYNFEAEMKHEKSSLDLNVDFYGRDFFPPAAYHSEGHQDGMGLCLYLALMKDLLDEEFSFVVLDDVLTSVDSGHRRKVCDLLKEKFGDSTQFIITTHDDIWLRHMQSASLIKKDSGFSHFRSWNVDSGIVRWNENGIWKEIKEHLTDNNVRDAAALMRHYLEYFSREACHNLRVPVVFRNDDDFALGDLLPCGVSRFISLLGDGIKSAKRHNRVGEINEIQKIIDKIEVAKSETDLDKWQMNGSIHYTEKWGGLDKNDFTPLVQGYEKLLELFECPNCEGSLRVVPERGEKENLKCRCGNIDINIRI